MTVGIWEGIRRFRQKFAVHSEMRAEESNLKLYDELLRLSMDGVKAQIELIEQEHRADLDSMEQIRKILHVGVSNFTREQMEEAARFCPIEAYQPQYSMVFRTNEAQMQWAASQGMGVMSYGSLGAGILSGIYRTLPTFAPTDNRSRFYKHFQEPMFSKVMQVLEVMDQVSAGRDGTPLSQIALNWAAQKEFVSTSIVGAQYREKIQENAAAFTWTLTAEEMRLLDEAVARYLDEGEH